MKLPSGILQQKNWSQAVWNTLGRSGTCGFLVLMVGVSHFYICTQSKGVNNSNLPQQMQWCADAGLIKAPIVKLHWSEKIGKNCIQREKVTSSGRCRHLRSCYHQTIFHAPAKTSTLPICFEISNTNCYEAGPLNAYVWASLIYQPNTFHPKAKHPNLSIWEKHQKIIKVWQVFKTNFGNKEWDQSDLDTAKDEGDLERSCKFDCQWFCPDWFRQSKINSQPKRGTNTGHFS